MKGDKRVIEALNRVLTRELTAINQYFLHARILQDRGFAKLGGLEYKASIDEMKHADALIKRILFLEGIPDIQKIDPVNIGREVAAIIASDLAVEYEAVPTLKESIKLCEQVGDYATRELFVGILTSEEEHIDWLETQQNLIEKVGIENYMQSQIEMEG